ncbi:Biotin carboxyl carrier protein of acetyl-CoA carboxylase [Pseudonocardia sp. Ae717_Ps2]|uniref:acetyl-CoA carboxylase biotin carboxyl carrier protein n=1 Tax=Pseudonocardia sp. Ae717_Ps2 TaxID=1885573 RepID=UPI00094B6A12|nr:biotin/lipoyl-containing protein [Pseudonocardia sp. Ae717_Ps2]OLM27821.1 Biotin carboxyl carrier protein of acetyl-CoA carboxylase [Pseudonocardia sp. Ae717_Ps2]
MTTNGTTGLRTGLSDTDTRGRQTDAMERLCRHALDFAQQSAPARLFLRDGESSLEVEWAAGAAAPAAAAPIPKAESETSVAVTAALVGTFYHRPEPGAAPFVVEGDEVRPGQQLGIVEAMKLMNPVECPVAGRVAAVEAPDGSGVEFGQVLFRIEPGRPE